MLITNDYHCKQYINRYYLYFNMIVLLIVCVILSDHVYAYSNKNISGNNYQVISSEEHPLSLVKEINESPRLILDKQLFDFGEVKPNSTNIATFNLINTGNDKLIIKDIKKCCGAIIKLDKSEFAPGEKGILTAEYRAGRDSGIFKKEIGLKTNDPNVPQITITVIGRIIKTLSWEPEKIIIDPFENEMELPGIVIKSLDNTKFSVKNFASSGKCLSTDYDPNYSAMEIILKPKLVVEKVNELNTNSGSISIELNHPDYQTISLNFDIIPSLQSVPPHIFVFPDNVHGLMTKKIVLKDNQNKNNANISEQIESIASENGTKVELISSVMEDKNCKLDLKITPVKNKDSESILKDQIVIKLKDGRTLNIPMRIFYATQTLTSKAN